MTDQAEHELKRAAVMFPRLFLWIIGSLMSLLTIFGGVVVQNLYSAAEEVKKQGHENREKLTDHDTRLRLLEKGIVDQVDRSKETREDVREIRKLLERGPRNNDGSGGSGRR